MILVLALVALVLFGNTEVMAFELLRSDGDSCGTAPNLRWSPPRVGLDLGDLDARDQQLANEAVAEWESALGARFSFVSGSGAACDLDDGVTALAFTERDCQGAEYGRDTLAITVTTWVNNRIIDADVSFNPDAPFTNAGFRQVVMHEIGHVIGLDHSDACGGSPVGTLMQSRLFENFSEPQADDLAGARLIYSGGDFGVPDGANGCAIQAPAGRSWNPVVFGFVAILLGRSLFRERRMVLARGRGF